MIIDVHGHITPPELLKRFPMPPSLGDIEGMIAQKQQAGVDLTIVGSPVGFGTMMRVPSWNNFTQSSEDLKRFHDWLGETVCRYSRHLRAYAFVNPFGGEEMLAEAARLVKSDAFVGLIANTSVCGQYLDSERADDFFAMAAELDVPILLHPPAEPVGSDSLYDPRLVEQVGRFCDVSVSLAALVFSGRLEQYPNLKIIGATGGGALSLLAYRLETAYRPRHWGNKAPAPDAKQDAGTHVVPDMRPSEIAPPGSSNFAIQVPQNKISQNPGVYIKRLYVDTANFSVPGQLANLEMVGADHMLFATDSPPLSISLTEWITMIDSLPLTAEEKQCIFSRNACELFKLGLNEQAA